MITSKNALATRLSTLRLCGTSGKAFLKEASKFHSALSPGLLLGGIMTDWAMELLEANADTGAVVETKSALPDAVQLLTGCTIGNGRLLVLEWGKLALSLYDRTRAAGYRIWLDPKKTRRLPRLYHWQLRLPAAPSTEEVVLDILNAGRSALSCRAVPILRSVASLCADGAMDICPRCEEVHPSRQGAGCLACRGASYYEIRQCPPWAP